MLIIAEIILTITAWRKGWKWMALLPVGIALVLAFTIGICVGLSGGGQAQVKHLNIALLPLDFIVIGVLIFMTARGRKEIDAKEAAPPQGVPAASN